MGYETILFECDGPVAKITLNRPQAMNSLTWELVTETGDALAICEQSADIRAVILTGNGRAFCAGADVANLATRTGNEAIRYLYELADAVHERMVVPIRRMAKPVIAAVNGVVAGGGLGIALSCDLRIAAVESKYIMAYSGVAICPDCGTSFFLSRIVGPAKVMEMYLLNEPLTSEQALNLGLVSRTVASAELMLTVQEIASRLAQGPTVAIGHTKHLLNRSSSNDLVAQLQDEAIGVGYCATTDDHLEGLAAFAAKRVPRFKGR